MTKCPISLKEKVFILASSLRVLSITVGKTRSPEHEEAAHIPSTQEAEMNADTWFAFFSFFSPRSQSLEWCCLHLG